MAENKTKETPVSVDDFLAAVPSDHKREDGRRLAALMERLSGAAPRMWGTSIVGFGSYHYRYESGREGDAPRVGFSPRSTALVLYVMDGFPGHAELLGSLGPHKTGQACLYIKKLADVDMDVLEKLVAGSLAEMAKRYPD